MKDIYPIYKAIWNGYDGLAMANQTALRTALYDQHLAAGGKIVDFHGWDLPVQYSGLADEHHACRTAAALFDTSHMGEIHVEGSDAEGFLNFLCTNDISKLADGKALYTVACLENGGIVDDLIVYRRGAERYLVVVNASNVEKDFQHFQLNARDFDVRVENKSHEYTQIAVQGPQAQSILSQTTDLPLSELSAFEFKEGNLLGETSALVARTGYTGEDGFEIYCPWSEGPRIWNALLEKGAPLGLKPAGLGARDTLRLEAKLSLYGNDIDETTHPLEAGLSWLVKFKKDRFIGRDTLLKIKEEGVKRKLVGLELKDRGVLRTGYPIFSKEGKQLGKVTSGTHSPTLKKAIGLGYIERPHDVIGNLIQVEIRGRRLSAEIVSTPFYRRPKE